MPDVIVFERFADFLEKKDRFKKNYVHKVISQGVYQPQEDYYLRLRQKLISLFRKNSSLDELDEILKKITPKKFDNYETLIDQIQNFMQGKTYTWITPPRYQIDYSRLELTVNPEIGLCIEGEDYFIKMYFKKQPLNATKVKVMIKIMQDTFKEDYPNARYAVWDIRQNIFYDKKANEVIKIPYNLKQEALIWLKYASEE
ncbi:TPA: hypothetical protein CPU00_08930 [Candidatus Gastranaerophilales bacterium HUM_18]|nr:MAG TPA: hypothetical protein CPU00_08930 [Candidatus Gastranaerophilales bacterium HUM_18]